MPADRSISEIQKALVQHGATGVLYKYEQGTGRIDALQFLLSIRGQDVGFSLPVNWRKFQAVLKAQNIKRSNDEEYVYRVSWRNIRDWVLAQLALYETEIVDMPQIFLPFAVTPDGSTLYERVTNGNLLLGDGK